MTRGLGSDRDWQGMSTLWSTPNPWLDGVELYGAMKNIFGICSGLDFGDNTCAALITRGMAEFTGLGLKMGCMEQTFSGLARIGNLIVTATIVHNRNNKCGYLIGQGKKT